jgi:diguanylate cyclase (GGDEF)-like protein
LPDRKVDDHTVNARAPDGTPADPLGPSGDDAGQQDGAIRAADIELFPTATAHRTFLAVGLIVLAGCLIILAVSTRRGSPGWLQVLAVVALVATGLTWYRGYRRRRYGGWDGYVDAATVFLITLTAQAMPLTAGTGVLVIRTLLATMAGSLLAKLAHSAAGFACLAVALALTGPQLGPVVRGLLGTGLGLVAVTLLFDRFWRNLARSDSMLERRAVLARASHQLAGGGDQRRISQVILDAATGLAGDPVRAAVAVGSADRLVVRAATENLDAALGAVLRSDGGRLRPALPGQPQTVPVLPLLDDRSATVLGIPITTHGTLYGVLLVGLDRPPGDPDVRAALEWLCSSAGPSLATAALTAELVNLAFYDPLTQLPNRAMFGEHAATALARAARDGTTVGVLVLDLDGFKQINDQFGHRTGDEVLVIAAARLRDQIRDADVAARLGGDEFAVLLPDVRGVEEATTIARRISSALSLKLRPGTATVEVGASIGIATWPAAPVPADAGERDQTSPPTPDVLLHDADTAMYAAKGQGVGYRVFTGAGDTHAKQTPPARPDPENAG